MSEAAPAPSGHPGPKSQQPPASSTAQPKLSYGPTTLKYHIIRQSESDFTLSTNPTAKHYDANVGPTYAARLSTFVQGTAPNNHDIDDHDSSFSLLISVHQYDNFDESRGLDPKKTDDLEKYLDTTLIPIVHVQRDDGASTMSVTVMDDNGQTSWKTEMQLHSDPYTGKSKFVFADPWGKQWAIVGKEELTCEGYTGPGLIAILERKKLAGPKVGWLTLQEKALDMLDIMIATHMAVYCFWHLEVRPSRLASVATGLTPRGESSSRSRAKRLIRRYKPGGNHSDDDSFDSANDSDTDHIANGVQKVSIGSKSGPHNERPPLPTISKPAAVAPDQSSRMRLQRKENRKSASISPGPAGSCDAGNLYAPVAQSTAYGDLDSLPQQGVYSTPPERLPSSMRTSQPPPPLSVSSSHSPPRQATRSDSAGSQDSSLRPLRLVAQAGRLSPAPEKPRRRSVIEPIAGLYPMPPQADDSRARSPSRKPANSLQQPHLQPPSAQAWREQSPAAQFNPYAATPSPGSARNSQVNIAGSFSTSTPAPDKASQASVASSTESGSSYHRVLHRFSSKPGTGSPTGSEPDATKKKHRSMLF
ncbi:uncharacterized protein V1518DRAFT_411898 [Limtongia smithiae]|uniref:uncharacterized protein n=1 Tax=Limtongia smithiae TaxID=1125753 RepID=UPI0034D008FF